MSSDDIYRTDSMMANNEEEVLKIAVLGKSLTGKTALAHRFISNKFTSEHETTMEEQYKVSKVINSINCRLEILDTAGQDDYQALIDNWIKFGEGFVLVYSIDDLESFDDVKKKYERIIKDKKNELHSFIIVGNKCDIADNERKVSIEEAQAYCSAIDVSFLEVSAKEKINVSEAFLLVAKNLLMKKTITDSTKLRHCSCCIIY